MGKFQPNIVWWTTAICSFSLGSRSVELLLARKCNRCFTHVYLQLGSAVFLLLIEVLLAPAQWCQTPVWNRFRNQEDTILDSMKIISRCHCTSIHTFIDYFFQTSVPIRDSYSLLKQRIPLFQWLAYLNDKNDDYKHKLSLYAACREMKIE